jgi:ketosteroid isomerase-like protein
MARGVRTPVSLPSETGRRTLDERMLVRFPGLVRALASAWSRLPPRSRLRRAMTARVFRQGFGAANRRDFDVLFLLLDSAVEFELPESLAGRFVPPDLVGVHRGHDGYLRVWEGLLEAWDDLKLEPAEVIDFGDRLLAAGRLKGHARHTGIALDEPLFQVFTLRDGFVVRQKDFIGERDKALEAVGLAPE